MSDSTVSVGFVGVGGRGRDLLSNTLKIPNVAVTHISDTSAESRTKAVKMIVDAGQKAPVEHENWQKVLEQKSVEAVVSLTAGGSADQVIARYREHVANNQRRLSE